MLSGFLPTCPRLHPGMMVPDDSYRYGSEWVCRVCGTRLYGNDQGGAELPQIASEKPINENLGNLSGRPRNNTTHHRVSKDRGGRMGRGGKWYE
jgi:hypothetical protein